MPRLVVFGRQSAIGSDDLGIPAALEALAHSIWLGWCSYGFYRLGGFSYHCSAWRGGVSVYVLVAGPIAFGLVLSVWKLRVSMQGTIVNCLPRQSSPSLLVTKLVVDSLLAASLIACWAWLSQADLALCDPSHAHFLLVCVRRAWILIGLAGFCTWHWSAPGLANSPARARSGPWWGPWGARAREAFQRSSSVDSRSSGHRNLERSMSVGSALAVRWKLRLASMGRFVGLDNHPILADVAKLFINFFKEDVDLVPTDVLACLLLLEQDQRTRLPRLPIHCPLSPSSSPFNPPTAPLNPSSAQRLAPGADWMTAGHAAHYMQFAGAAYGWPMYTLRGWRAVFSLANLALKSRYIPRSMPGFVVDDNPWLGNTTVIKTVTGASDADLVYVSYRNKLFEVPFFIALDHKFRAVVVSVRGTLSIEDILTDLLACESSQLDLADLKDGRAHEGMLQAASNLHHKLLDSSEDCVGLLTKAWIQLEQCVGHMAAKEYRLVVTGHSLGAGVAAILAMMLRQTEAYSDLRCFAFSPPGGLVSLNAAEYASPFVCSVVLGDDVVCRLGLYSLFEFKARVLTILKACDIPKVCSVSGLPLCQHVVFGGWLRRRLGEMFGSPSLSRSMDTQSLTQSWTADTDAHAKQAMAKYEAELEAVIASTERERDEHSRLYLPGTVLYLREIVTGRPLFRAVEKVYSLHFCRGDNALLDEIIVSPNMIGHHVPWAVLDSLQYLAANDNLSDTSDSIDQ